MINIKHFAKRHSFPQYYEFLASIFSRGITMSCLKDLDIEVFLSRFYFKVHQYRMAEKEQNSKSDIRVFADANN